MTSPWRDPGPDPAVIRILKQRPPTIRPEPSLLRDPARILILLGTIVAAAASPLPWLVRVGNPPERTMSGWSGFADGFLIAVAAVAMTVLVLNREVAGSSARILRWSMPVLAIVILVLAVGSIRNLENQIEIWSIEGATGEYQPWLFVCLAGAVVAAAGGLWIWARGTLAPPWRD